MVRYGSVAGVRARRPPRGPRRLGQAPRLRARRRVVSIRPRYIRFTWGRITGRATWTNWTQPVPRSPEEGTVGEACEVCGREKARDWEQAAMVTALCQRHLVPGTDDTVCTRLGYQHSQEALAAARRECAGGSFVVGKALADLAEQECENGLAAVGETCIASAQDPDNIGEPDYRFQHWCGPCIASTLIALASDAETALAAPAAGEEGKR
jgi:hypothetical protein